MVQLACEPPDGASCDDHAEIPLWLRIGVFGHRGISPDHRGLMRAVGEALAAITDIQESMRVEYTHMRIGLAVVSSLAEGADRVLARAILARQAARLEVVLPMDRDDYSSDFHLPGSRDDFDDLMHKGTVDIVGSAKSRKHAYESAGQAVVDRSDVVVAVWDGKHARGRGGTQGPGKVVN
jgi:hypothetical protein